MKKIELPEENVRDTFDDYAEEVLREAEAAEEYFANLKNPNPIESTIKDFISIVFGRFANLYEKVLESGYKAQIEKTTMDRLTSDYTDDVWDSLQMWHPDKTLESVLKCLRWYLNCSRSYDYHASHCKTGIDDELKKMVFTIDTRPLRTTNIFKFEAVWDGVERMHSPRYRRTAANALVSLVIDDTYSMDAKFLLNEIVKGMKTQIDGPRDEYGVTRYQEHSIYMCSWTLQQVTKQFERVLERMEIVYKDFMRGIHGGTCAKADLYKINLQNAARMFGHDKSVSEMITGIKMAKQYGYGKTITINRVNNAIYAKRLYDKRKIDKSDFIRIIENGVL